MRIATILLVATALVSGPGRAARFSLEQGFAHPPREARLRAYWWWLNGNVTRQSITRDLEEMAKKGFGGALICDAGGAEQDGNDRVPHGPTFFTPEWRDLYRHALHEAARLGLELSLNIQSGWNLGGPMVKAEDAPKKLVWSETRVSGPTPVHQALPAPKHSPELYKDVVVLALPLRHDADSHKRRPIQLWEKKALHSALAFSAPDTTPLLEDLPPEPGEEDAKSSDVVDLSGRVSGDGVLDWTPPPGEWEILRFGCTLNDHSRVSTCSDGWQGYALDPFDAAAFRSYWQQVVEPLIADAGPLAGSTLRYLHTDSWEVEAANWTPTLREEFRKRRGYDMLAFFPAVAGRIIDSRGVTNRFLHDFRKTMGDLAVDNHFRLFSAWAAKHGLLLHPESGGPHAVPIDSLRCLGIDDAPMSEFWAWSWRHRVGDQNRFFVKQPASAAHTYGHRLVLAEGFTTIGPHWQETLWDNLKPAFDQALCEGLNRLVWHAFTCSPAEAGLPGQEYFAGTHFNPNSTWWGKSAAFLSYINRSQYMLQQGQFVADALYYYGDHVPNFAQLKRSDPARVLPGYDYDVATEEVLLSRVSVAGKRISLPDGMSYSLIVMPQQRAVSLPVLRRLKLLVEAGATIVGPQPEQATGLAGFPDSDREVGQIADALWGPTGHDAPGERRVGKGRVIRGRTARAVLLADGIPPDFEFRRQGATVESGPAVEGPNFDYIHRRDGDTEIYFVANRANRSEEVECTFRVSGSVPEIWDPVSGKTRSAVTWSRVEGRTIVPLEFAPYGSEFIVFRKPTSEMSGRPGSRNFVQTRPLAELAGPWTVLFDPRWGGPASAEFRRLSSWTTRPEEGIRYYSGTATYRKTFDLPANADPKSPIFLDLGDVRQLAEVHLNGRSLGVLWAVPFRVDISGAVKPTGNTLEIEVVNFWPNRIIGDQNLAPAERLTRTNIRKLTKDTPLMDSGLLGPVRLLSVVETG
jgi:hypothetical protein